MRKFLSVTLLIALSIVLFTANVYAIKPNGTPTVPLANISVYKLFYNMGYIIDTHRPAGITPEGYQLYATGMPLEPLIQSQRFANMVVLSNPDGNSICGIKFFFDVNGNKSDMVNVISKFIKALDENAYNEMGAQGINQQLNEFLSSYETIKRITAKSMNRYYKFYGETYDGVLEVNIVADWK